jgi:hypothetical protein
VAAAKSAQETAGSLPDILDIHSPALQLARGLRYTAAEARATAARITSGIIFLLKTMS